MKVISRRTTSRVQLRELRSFLEPSTPASPRIPIPSSARRALHNHPVPRRRPWPGQRQRCPVKKGSTLPRVRVSGAAPAPCLLSIPLHA
ncbi:hypothetical protein K458DRAFT_66758 [Lentithecium fluviatile CBS 122367]|uniref:Uncharacterized protein n=1 Tax=Lentithecium fluviatile CBS 122367 TaxID=1168545 RepID=A0A6G1JLM5_9PLEO|nr:hypothetical protein K458DRAFT_66758 [Lentithecium fluviatile CBS 122367]